jgi:hypothetical protein
MSDKMQWPMPALPIGDDSKFRELWYNDHLIMLVTSRMDPGEVELTQEVWDELPENIQEGFFKLSLLEQGAVLEGVGWKSATNWLRLDYGDEGKTHDYDLFVRLRNKYSDNYRRVK